MSDWLTQNFGINIVSQQRELDYTYYEKNHKMVGDSACDCREYLPYMLNIPYIWPTSSV